MIRHICAFRVRPDIPAEDVEAVLVELRELVASMPGLHAWEQGPNLGLRDTTYSHGFAALFESAQDLSDYLHHPRHEAFVRHRWRPVVEARVIVNFVVEP